MLLAPACCSVLRRSAALEASAAANSLCDLCGHGRHSSAGCRALARGRWSEGRGTERGLSVPGQGMTYKKRNRQQLNNGYLCAGGCGVLDHLRDAEDCIEGLNAAAQRFASAVEAAARGL